MTACYVEQNKRKSVVGGGMFFLAVGVNVMMQELIKAYFARPSLQQGSKGISHVWLRLYMLV